MSPAWSIAARDLRELRRDGRLQVLVACIVLVLVVAAIGGASRAARAAAERGEAQRAERDRWLDQGDVNPHAAAHYGTFVFAPIEPLSFVDPGVSPFVGAAVFLEAHQQQLARHRPVEDAAPFRRLSVLSVATCLQVFVPLFIVLLATAAVARERERGTWRLLIASGVRPGTVLGGKALGVGFAVLLVVVPAVAVAVALLLSAPGVALDGDTAARGVTLLAAYVAHILTWLLLALAISVWASSTRQALAVGLALWLGACVIAPPALFAAAGARAPAPTAAAFAAAIDDERATRPTWDERVATATERFLSGEEMPPASNPEVVALIDTEASDTELYGRHLDALARIFARQTRLYRWLSVLSPTVSVQAASMALAATDDDHYRHFLDAASAYRSAVLAALNSELAAFDSWRTFNAAGNRDLWARVPEFTYDTPPLRWAVERLAVPASAMAAWLLAALGLLWRAAAVHGVRP